MLQRQKECKSQLRSHLLFRNKATLFGWAIKTWFSFRRIDSCILGNFALAYKFNMKVNDLSNIHNFLLT